MSPAAQVSIAAPPARVWGVLADIETWPSWSLSVASVVAEMDGERSAYRMERPPLPLALWTITEWRPEQGFTWHTRGASSLLSSSFTLTQQGRLTRVTHDLAWSGPMAWMARATYGPVSVRYAGEHVNALARRCES